VDKDSGQKADVYTAVTKAVSQHLELLLKRKCGFKRSYNALTGSPFIIAEF
jgi:hypothetical protein